MNNDSITDDLWTPLPSFLSHLGSHFERVHYSWRFYTCNMSWFRLIITEITYQPGYTYIPAWIYHVRTDTMRTLVTALITLCDCRLTTADAPEQLPREPTIRRLPVSPPPPRGPALLEAPARLARPDQGGLPTYCLSLSTLHSPTVTSTNILYILWLPNHKSKTQLYMVYVQCFVKNKLLKNPHYCGMYTKC